VFFTRTIGSIEFEKARTEKTFAIDVLAVTRVSGELPFDDHAHRCRRPYHGAACGARVLARLRDVSGAAFRFFCRSRSGIPKRLSFDVQRRA